MVLDTVNKFILFACPDVQQETLYRGYENRNALPGEQDYTVYAIDSTARRGTNVNDFAQTVDDTMITKVLREYLVTVDFCNNSQETARNRAANLEGLANCYIGIDFFKKDNIGFTYADEPEYLPYTDLTEQYIHRYRVTLHMTVWEDYTAVQQYADEVVLRRVENIDAHHKP